MPVNVGRPSGTANTFSNNAKTLLESELLETNKLLKNVEVQYGNRSIVDTLSKFQKYPVTFAEKILGQTLTPDQKKILRMLHTPPYRLMVSASHSVGKTFICAIAVIHFFFTFKDSITLTTAPTTRQVTEAMWRNIRDLNKVNRNVYRGAYAPKMELSDTHFAMGFVPNDADALNGLHSKSGHLLLVFDEAVGIPKPIWEAAHGIDNEEVRWVCIFNPTDTTSHCYSEWQTDHWHKMVISSMNHPNIIAELEGKSPPFPGAIRLQHFDELIKKWSQPIKAGAIKAGDIEWPPGSGQWLRPSPVAQSRLLGLWPSDSVDSLWNSSALEDAFNVSKQFEADDELVIGVDVARGGEDYSCIHVRYGNVSIEHERRNGLDTIELSGLVERIAQHYAQKFEKSIHNVIINVDITGIGAGVYDYLKMREMNVYDWNFGQKAFEIDKYSNFRSQIHFDLAERADNGQLDLTQMDDDIKEKIRSQSLGLRYTYDKMGRRVLEMKNLTKKRIGVSPDDLDAIALAYLNETPAITVTVSS